MRLTLELNPYVPMSALAVRLYDEEHRLVAEGHLEVVVEPEGSELKPQLPERVALPVWFVGTAVVQ